jgi:hypothetical protein
MRIEGRDLEVPMEHRGIEFAVVRTFPKVGYGLSGGMMAIREARFAIETKPLKRQNAISIT